MKKGELLMNNCKRCSEAKGFKSTLGAHYFVDTKGVRHKHAGPRIDAPSAMSSAPGPYFSHTNIVDSNGQNFVNVRLGALRDSGRALAYPMDRY